MIRDALRDLGIAFDGEYSKDGSYIIDLYDSVVDYILCKKLSAT